MTACVYCNAYVADGNLERHAEESEPCARKALAFVRGLPIGCFSRNDKAAALRRCRARLVKAKGKGTDGNSPGLSDLEPTGPAARPLTCRDTHRPLTALP